MTTITARIREGDGALVVVLPDGSECPLTPRPVRDMTDAEVVAAAMEDPDNPPMTSAELARMRPVPKVKRLRWQLGLGRESFAQRYHVPLRVVTAWERRQAEPDAMAEAYLDIIAADPEGVRKTLEARSAAPRAAE